MYYKYIKKISIDIFPMGYDAPIRVEFWGDEVDNIKSFDLESQLSKDELDKVDIYPYTEFLIDSYNDSIDKKQKYLLHYAKEISSLWEYIGGFKVFYYDYNQIEEGYKMLRETIINYDKDNVNTSGIRTDYMYDLGDVSFKNEVFVMNFDNILPHIKLNFEDKFISGNIEKYNGNIEFVKRDLEKYMLHKKTVVLCVDSEFCYPGAFSKYGVKY